MGIKKKPPKFRKATLIAKQLNELNTEPHIYRYKTLYNIYNALYITTYKKPLSNLDYYIEDDGFLIAEIKGTGRLFLKERLKLHIDLLRKIKNGENLDYAKNKISIKDDNIQLSLFS